MVYRVCLSSSVQTEHVFSVEFKIKRPDECFAPDHIRMGTKHFSGKLCPVLKIRRTVSVTKVSCVFCTTHQSQILDNVFMKCNSYPFYRKH